ncbi:ketopantoate reductase family protein [Shimazuella kribbensis]|uniref:ketopantoate reductase family protein n=1 Tax=Shimazuella kribbensis TaxID=139808 RepID=UPI0003FB431C|nr:2-dehydropantoate 2-reductase [Shimazuella kribbensis]
MKIGIIGGGSLGLLWAARLNEYADVTLFCRTVQQTDVIKKQGLLVTNTSGQKKRYLVSAEWIEHFHHSAGFDVLFLMVKQPALDQVLRMIPSLIHQKTHVVAWQNGLGHVEKIEACHFPASYAVVTTEGAYKLSANHVQHTGYGYVRLGRLQSKDGMDSFFSSFLQKFHIELVDHIEQYLWRKFAVNVVINPLTALLEVPNGKLMDLDIQATIYQLVNELCLVADAKGICLKQADIYDQVSEVCSKTAKNFSSMLQDIRAGRLTEIDSLNGMVVTYANQCGLVVPTHSTLTDLIRAKSMLF